MKYCNCENNQANVLEDSKYTIWTDTETIFYPQHKFCKDCGKPLQPLHMDGCYVSSSRDSVMLSLTRNIK